MGTLRCSSGLAIVLNGNCSKPCENYNGLLRMHGCSKARVSIFTNFNNPCLRAFELLAVHSAATDLEIIDSPVAEETINPYPYPLSQPLRRRWCEDDRLWTASEIAEAINGEIIRRAPSGTISIDSRTLVPGQWFFAIHGENFDGHDFVDESLADKGCVGIIGNRVCGNWDRGFIRVEGDTLIALEKLAKYARNRFDGILVGLTGSVGKTTTRSMISLALESLGRTHQTRGNFNYMVGVSLTLIGIPLDAKFAVVELGFGGLEGEILKMAQMCQPSVRVLLNVRHSHMEHFTSLEDVARAKGELLKEAQPGDICVLNADDPLIMNVPVPAGVQKVLFGQKRGCDVRLALAEKSVHELVEFKIPAPGLHLATNACAAAAVAVSLGIPLAQIGESLSRFRPVPMRSDVQVTDDGITIIDDTYNANPTSMAAAINSLKTMQCMGKRVAILGDMLELGAAEAEAHELVLKLCSDPCIGLVILAGKRFTAAAEKVNFMRNHSVLCATDAELLLARMNELLVAGDVVLVKGSRGMQMEKVVDMIKAVSG
uniref:UDP-MurNAc-pentapeptide synthetase n=1 Tax=Ananas comosus var. bracteatus TaxID=296719 RepID=A0A6V7QMV8_ANACO|nr:unnamed protein product [Ananas comosus var. bracteatus]